MKKRLLVVMALSAILVLAFALAAQAQEPELEITSPKEGDTVKGPNVTVRATVENFTINAQAVNQAPKEGEGHIHWALDGAETPKAADNITFENVPAGSHEITVRLVNNDHSALDPPVSKSIKINVGTAEAQEAAGTGTSLPMIALLGALLLGAGLFLRFRPGRTVA